MEQTRVMNKISTTNTTTATRWNLFQQFRVLAVAYKDWIIERIVDVLTPEKLIHLSKVEILTDTIGVLFKNNCCPFRKKTALEAAKEKITFDFTEIFNNAEDQQRDFTKAANIIYTALMNLQHLDDVEIKLCLFHLFPILYDDGDNTTVNFERVPQMPTDMYNRFQCFIHTYAPDDDDYDVVIAAEAEEAKRVERFYIDARCANCINLMVEFLSVVPLKNDEVNIRVYCNPVTYNTQDRCILLLTLLSKLSQFSFITGNTKSKIVQEVAEEWTLEKNLNDIDNNALLTVKYICSDIYKTLDKLFKLVTIKSHLIVCNVTKESLPVSINTRHVIYDKHLLKSTHFFETWKTCSTLMKHAKKNVTVPSVRVVTAFVKDMTMINNFLNRLQRTYNNLMYVFICTKVGLNVFAADTPTDVFWTPDRRWCYKVVQHVHKNESVEILKCTKNEERLNDNYIVLDHDVNINESIAGKRHLEEETSGEEDSYDTEESYEHPPLQQQYEARLNKRQKFNCSDTEDDDKDHA